MNDAHADSDPAPAPPPEPASTLEQIKRIDARRDGFPGEHWIVLGAGLAIWVASSRSPSFLLRTLGLIAATALVGRAASGRDGLARLLRYLPVGSRIRYD